MSNPWFGSQLALYSLSSLDGSEDGATFAIAEILGCATARLPNREGYGMQYQGKVTCPSPGQEEAAQDKFYVVSTVSEVPGQHLFPDQRFAWEGGNEAMRARFICAWASSQG